VAVTEHARFGIRVNAVAPGFTLTAMADRDAAMMPGWKQARKDRFPKLPRSNDREGG
jgi:NAD(P)-dependent dehydrogenase (short-subunit alcohol dehydrogenase family)